MDAYLSRRTKDKPKKEDKEEKKKEVEVVEVEEIVEEVEITPRKRNVSFLKRFFDSLFGDAEEYPEVGEVERMKEEREFEDMEQKPKKRKKDLLSKLFGWLGGEEDTAAEEVAIQAHAEVNEDLKDALKIQNKWLQKLPAQSIRDFKASEDYKRYREILEKYKLLKK